MIDLPFEIHPALVFMIGGLVVAMLKGKVQSAVMLTLPFIAFAGLAGHEHGSFMSMNLFGYELEMFRVDKLSLLFGYLFCLASFIGFLFAAHIKDRGQQVSAVLYAGSAMGAVFAGDFLTLFVYWELLALTSVFLIWAARTKRSYGAGMRYLIWNIISGLILLTGLLLLANDTGSMAFEHLGLKSLADGGLAHWLIFIAFGIKAAFPFAHVWLTDSYAEATPTGAVFLSSFTSKVAVCCLARGFAGEELLIWIGGAMAAFPIFFAVIENDLRRVLAYSMVNQIGFMVVGIGVGTALSLNGAVAHAFADVVFKGLLFMSMGAVLQQTGRIHGSDLGGLYKTMPWTTAFCIVGAASISAFPLFSGFITKSMVMSGALAEGYGVIWLILLFASAGVFHHAGIKIPFFAFFGHDQKLKVKEAPINMRLAMGIAAAMCIFIGSYPAFLYGLLPWTVAYVPYTAGHVVTQTQILFFSALAFTVLMRTGIYPPELHSTNLDMDFLYRKPGKFICISVARTVNTVYGSILAVFCGAILAFVAMLKHASRQGGWLGQTWSTSVSAIMAALLLATLLLIYYL